MTVNGRSKGRAFEQRIARDLRAWLGDSATVQRRRNDQQASAGEFEITWEGGVFPWAIECKAHSSFRVAQLWTGQGPAYVGKPESWLEQCERQAHGAGLRPLLVINVPRRFVLCILGERDIDRLSTDHWSVCMDLPGRRVAVLWDELIKTPPALVARLGGVA